MTLRLVAKVHLILCSAEWWQIGIYMHVRNINNIIEILLKWDCKAETSHITLSLQTCIYQQWVVQKGICLCVQAVESGTKNKRLMKKMADVQGENSLAASLLQAFHLKVAHMQGMNESLRVKVAIMERQADVQVNRQGVTVVLSIIIHHQTPVLVSSTTLQCCKCTQVHTYKCVIQDVTRCVIQDVLI